MKDFTIIDRHTNQKISISFSQYYDLIIGMKCASDTYGEENEKSRVKDFEKMITILKSLT